MKVTAFNPIYGTAQIDEAVAFFANLGFKEIHKFQKEGFELRVLENEEGLRLDIMNNEFVRENGINQMFASRLNVDDFEEAISFFENQGAKQLMPVIDETSRLLTTFQTKNGDIFTIVKHVK